MRRGRLRRGWYNSPIWRYQERKAYLAEKRKAFVSTSHAPVILKNGEPSPCACYECKPRTAPRAGYPRF